MPFDAPFQLGPFSVDAEGRLSPSDPTAAPAFLFRWNERVVRARLDQADGEAGLLRLQVTLGRVRSTASTLDETLRPRSFTLVHWLGRTVPPAWRVALLADHRVRLATDTPLGLPITAAGLITKITQFTLELAPYLELMEEIGLASFDKHSV